MTERTKFCTGRWKCCMRRVIRCRDTEYQTRGYRYVYCFELCNYVHCYGRVSVKIHLKISFSRPSPTRILKIIFSYSEKSKKKLVNRIPFAPALYFSIAKLHQYLWQKYSFWSLCPLVILHSMRSRLGKRHHFCIWENVYNTQIQAKLDYSYFLNLFLTTLTGYNLKYRVAQK